MANQVDPTSGFCHTTKTYHSLRPSVPLPPISQPLSITDYALSLIPPSSLPTTVLIDSTTGNHITYTTFLNQIKNLTLSLSSSLPHPLSKGHVAFILSPPSLHLPTLYFSLLSLGVVVSPSNPISSNYEIAHQIHLSHPIIAFATSSTAHKIPNLPFGTVLIDSPHFLSMINGNNSRFSVHRDEISQLDSTINNDNFRVSVRRDEINQLDSMINGKNDNFRVSVGRDEVSQVVDSKGKNDNFRVSVGRDEISQLDPTINGKNDNFRVSVGRDEIKGNDDDFRVCVGREEISQLDTAAILYSSGTTGKVKGVKLTHRNLIALIGGFYHLRHVLEDEEVEEGEAVSLFTLPLFHVFGFFMMIRAISMGERLVLMGRFEFESMLRAVERYGVTYMPVSPPLIVALAKSEVVEKYDLRSLRLLGCGGAPLGKEVAENFKARFPNVEIVQGYGLTESGGGATRMIGPEEAKRHGSVGRLAENMEAKIVDPATGESLPPGQRGELWLRGPTIMKGYVKNEEATAETLDSEGWLKTGDLCYFDSDGFLYIVDRLKELIKYKAYQVPPAELEHILHAHPEIADAAVVPYPDEEAGQIPMAFVVRKPGSNINAYQVMDFVAKQVAPYKKIRRVAFINAIPKNPAGKILRRELVDSALSSGSSKL